MARIPVVVRWVIPFVLIAIVGGYLWFDRDRLRDQEVASRECLAVAPAAAVALFSYDYRSFDASVANGQSFATGTFAGEYAKTTASLKALAVKEQAVVAAQANAAGVISASSDEVQVLLYVNQFRRNTNISGEKVDQNRVILTMVRVDGAWKVSAASAV